MLCKRSNEDFKELIEQLRKHTVDFIYQHKEVYSDFIAGDFDSYLKEMSISGTWGGGIEIAALCNLLGCDMSVYDRAANITILFKPDMKLATFAMVDHVALYLSFENNNRYSFNFSETNFHRERRERFYELPSASGVTNSFFTKTEDKHDEINQEDSQPGIKASR